MVSYSASISKHLWRGGAFFAYEVAALAFSACRAACPQVLASCFSMEAE
jgi:hypothetical protein